MLPTSKVIKTKLEVNLYANFIEQILPCKYITRIFFIALNWKLFIFKGDEIKAVFLARKELGTSCLKSRFIVCSEKYLVIPTYCL